MPLHLIKLSVGATCLDDLRRWQDQHGRAHPPLRHRTRHFPRRAEEILQGGSIYWVISRIVTARQRILGIQEAARDDGSTCTDLILDPALRAGSGPVSQAIPGLALSRGTGCAARCGRRCRGDRVAGGSAA
jgi:hypothetical protein